MKCLRWENYPKKVALKQNLKVHFLVYQTALRKDIDSLCFLTSSISVTLFKLAIVPNDVASL